MQTACLVSATAKAQVSKCRRNANQNSQANHDETVVENIASMRLSELLRKSTIPDKAEHATLGTEGQRAASSDLVKLSEVTGNCLSEEFLEHVFCSTGRTVQVWCIVIGDLTWGVLPMYPTAPDTMIKTRNFLCEDGMSPLGSPLSSIQAAASWLVEQQDLMQLQAEWSAERDKKKDAMKQKQQADAKEKQKQIKHIVNQFAFAEERQQSGRPAAAIPWGHSKGVLQAESPQASIRTPALCSMLKMVWDKVIFLCRFGTEMV